MMCRYMFNKDCGLLCARCFGLIRLSLGVLSVNIHQKDSATVLHRLFVPTFGGYTALPAISAQDKNIHATQDRNNTLRKVIIK